MDEDKEPSETEIAICSLHEQQTLDEYNVSEYQVSNYLQTEDLIIQEQCKLQEHLSSLQMNSKWEHTATEVNQ